MKASTPLLARASTGGRPAVITADMLHTVVRRRANGETVEQIRPDLIISTGKRKGQSPSVANIYRALAEYEKSRAYPDAVEQAKIQYAEIADGAAVDVVRPRQNDDSADAALERRVSSAGRT